MADQAEIVIARSLRRFLATQSDTASTEPPQRWDVFNGFEYFLPKVLGQIYDYWKNESFDGFFAAQCRKIGPNSAEIIGVCILISDQTVTPIHVRLGISPSEDVIVWMECKVGVRGDGQGGMKRTPYSIWRKNPLIAIPRPIESIDWMYKISLGHDTHSAI
jgi:hypothetical protein